MRTRPRSMVTKFETSTRAEIGRKPMARKRCANQGGLGRFFRFRKCRPTTNLQAFSSDSSIAHFTGLSYDPDTGCIAAHGAAIAIVDKGGNLYGSDDHGRRWTRRCTGLSGSSSALIVAP